MVHAAGIRLPDYLVILSYFAVVIVIGLLSGRYIRRSKDYFAAGNVMPWWLAGTSFYKASFSALLFVIYNEIAYKYGIVAVVILWISPLCIVLGGLLTARAWRRARVMTPLGFMERRYSATVHQVFVWTGLPLRLFDNALKILSTSIIFAVALRGLGLSTPAFMAAIGLIMVLYSFLGGQMTVIVTDFLNVAILAVSVLSLFVLTLVRVGNLGAFVRALPAGFFDPAPEPYGWTYLAFTVFLVVLLTYNASWALVQKYNTLRSETEIPKMIGLIAVLMFVMPPIFFLPGIAARVLLPAVGNAKEVYALVSMEILPVGMMGLVLASVISSTMSTLGSEFNTLSGILTRDFLKKKVRPGLSERQEIFAGRAFTVVIGAATVLLAVLFNALRGFNLMDIMFRVFSAFGPAAMIPLILGLLSRRFNARGTLWGLTAGCVSGVALVLANVYLVQVHAADMAANPTLDFWLRSGWNSAATVVSVLATVGGMALGTATRATPEAERARAEAFFADLRRPFLGDESRQGVASPFGVIGVMLTTFGGLVAAVAVIVLAVYRDPRAFRIDLVVGLVLVALGLLMRRGARGAERAAERPAIGE